MHDPCTVWRSISLPSAATLRSVQLMILRWHALNKRWAKVAAIKPQAAFFEQQGPAGMKILQSLALAAINADLLVIMDAKRGDIGTTSGAYAAGWIGHDAPFPSDALTINPWLGIDTLDPFLKRADETNSGLFILNQTSNPGVVIYRTRLLMASHYTCVLPSCWHLLLQDVQRQTRQFITRDCSRRHMARRGTSPPNSFAKRPVSDPRIWRTRCWARESH